MVCSIYLLYSIVISIEIKTVALILSRAPIMAVSSSATDYYYRSAISVYRSIKDNS